MDEKRKQKRERAQEEALAQIKALRERANKQDLNQMVTYWVWRKAHAPFASCFQVGQKVDEELVQSLVDGTITNKEAISTFPLAYYKKAISRIPASGPLYAKFKNESGNWRFTGYENEYSFVTDDELLIKPSKVWDGEQIIIDNWIAACNEVYQKLSFENEELRQLINQERNSFSGDVSAFNPEIEGERKTQRKQMEGWIDRMLSGIINGEKLEDLSKYAEEIDKAMLNPSKEQKDEDNNEGLAKINAFQ